MYGAGTGDGRQEHFGTANGDGEGDGNYATPFILLCTDSKNLQARAINLVARMQPP